MEMSNDALYVLLQRRSGKKGPHSIMLSLKICLLNSAHLFIQSIPKSNLPLSDIALAKKAKSRKPKPLKTQIQTKMRSLVFR